MCLSKEDKFIVYNSDRLVKFINSENGNFIRKFFGHNSTICCVAISNDCKFIISGSDDLFVKIWNVGVKVMEGWFMI